MAMLLIFCVISGILLSVGRPDEAKMVQRELEEELIFRGESYANAIKLYRKNTGQFPTELEQLVKVKPRILRKLYNCPITNKPFVVVTAVQPGATGVTTNLPISGVRSTSNLNGIKKYKDRELHSDWVFSAVDDLYGGGGIGGGMPPQGQVSPGQKPNTPPSPGKGR